MTATLATKQIKDGNSVNFQQRVLDVSGTGAGPFLPLFGLADPDGSGPVDVPALVATLTAAIAAGATDAATATGQSALGAKIGEVQADPTANTVLDRLKVIATGLGAVVLAAGTAVIGKVGLQVGGADVSASNPLPSRSAGPAFQASGVAAVTGTIAAAGNSTAFTPAAGRQAYLTLSGGTSLSGAIQWSLDGGTTWGNIVVEGTQLGVVSFVGTTITIPVPTPERTGAQIRLAASAASGTVAYSFSQ